MNIPCCDRYKGSSQESVDPSYVGIYIFFVGDDEFADGDLDSELPDRREAKMKRRFRVVDQLFGKR